MPDYNEIEQWTPTKKRSFIQQNSEAILKNQKNLDFLKRQGVTNDLIKVDSINHDSSQEIVEEMTNFFT